MDELDFTIELNSQRLRDPMEAELMAEADSVLRDLAKDHDDLTGAAINIRQPAQATTPYIYEVTVVVYARPENVAATKKDAAPRLALKEALDAAQRQVQKQRDKLRERWKEPGNDPVSQEMVEILTATESSK